MNSVNGARLSLISLIDFIRLQFNNEALIILKFSVGWCLECDVVSFWRETVKSNKRSGYCYIAPTNLFLQKKEIKVLNSNADQVIFEPLSSVAVNASVLNIMISISSMISSWRSLL